MRVVAFHQGHAADRVALVATEVAPGRYVAALESGRAGLPGWWRLSVSAWRAGASGEAEAFGCERNVLVDGAGEGGVGQP